MVKRYSGGGEIRRKTTDYRHGSLQEWKTSPLNLIILIFFLDYFYGQSVKFSNIFLCGTCRTSNSFSHSEETKFHFWLFGTIYIYLDEAMLFDSFVHAVKDFEPILL